ncbi:platelet basic protein [Equus asinus]|uniref:C-X-C motif chemokine n=1 Tax=Equus asinus TaxID=9793 RepID=A0A9L0K684_EQUAS|nr:platelet basic protein [Equus asinus]
MRLRPKATSSCTSASPLQVLPVLLLLSLLPTMLVSSTITIGEISTLAKSVDDELYAELRCLCVKTTSGIHPRIIQTLQVLRAGPHCSKVEVIATLKNGKEICLDPEAVRIKNIVQKILESDGSAASSVHFLSNLSDSQEE